VRPSEIEIGMPVSIRPNSSSKDDPRFAIGKPMSLSATGMAISNGGMSAGQRAPTWAVFGATALMAWL
jgi:hypothetical protein